jgi:hypothetical protein
LIGSLPASPALQGGEASLLQSSQNNGYKERRVFLAMTKRLIVSGIDVGWRFDEKLSF